MNDDLTLITVILDRSGSMDSIKEDMQGGLNQFIADQAAQPGECRVTMAHFDDTYEVIHDYKDIKDVESYTLVPRGMTALLDAIGKTVTSVGERLAALPEEERPGIVTVVIITDGLENASTEWTRDMVMALIKKQTDEFNWHFTYLGANQDAIAVGHGIGVPQASSMAYAATAGGSSSMYGSLSGATTSLRNHVSKTMSFTEEEREDAMDKEGSSS